MVHGLGWKMERCSVPGWVAFLATGICLGWSASALADFTVGGAVYVDVNFPLTSGLQNVTVVVEGGGLTFEGVTSGGSGVWFVEGLPEGVYNVTPILPDWCFQHVTGGIIGGPPPLEIIVDFDHRAANLSLQFLARQTDCVPLCGDGVCDAGESCDTCPQDCDCDCHASRDLSNPQPLYCPGERKQVTILITPPSGITAIGVEDAPPFGWVASNISNGGVWDAVRGQVKWGPFFEPFPSELRYDVTPSFDDSGTACFEGTISFDGMNEGICGEGCTDAECCPHMRADQPREECPGCLDCSACGSCEDRQVVLCEMSGYACAWNRGCNDDLSGMTRAAFIWKTDECYCWQADESFWFGTDCPAPDSGCCLASAAGSHSAGRGEGANRNLPRLYHADVDTVVTISIVPPVGTVAWALAEAVPQGWTVTAPSHGGSWIAGKRSVRWGPFFDEPFPADLTYRIRPPKGETGEHCLTGAVSFDGFDESIKGESCVREARLHDSNSDGQIDLNDYADFLLCASPNGKAATSGFDSGRRGCIEIFDADGSGALDLTDWGSLQAAFTVPD